MKNILCFFDGCCEPKNPGGAMGIGSLIICDGQRLLSTSRFVPVNPDNTNNIAEYLALEEILDYLINNDLTADNIVIKGDSQLAIKQMTGEYGMNGGAYIPYARRCLTKISEFKKKPTFKWIPREENEQADNLSKGKLTENNIEVKTHSDDKNILQFGKYKGKSINDIEDIQYLKWVLSEVKIKPIIRDMIEKRIAQFANLAR